jgi:hypothetical protein
MNHRGGVWCPDCPASSPEDAFISERAAFLQEELTKRTLSLSYLIGTILAKSPAANCLERMRRGTLGQHRWAFLLYVS